MEERENMNGEGADDGMEEMQDRGAIELHPEAAKHRQDTYSSLTDLAGIDVFSDKFEETVGKVRKENESRSKEIQEGIFVEKVIREQDMDTEITSYLFLEQKTQVLLHDYEKNEKGWSVMNVSLVLIAVLAVSAIYIFFFNDRKIRRKKI